MHACINCGADFRRDAALCVSSGTSQKVSDREGVRLLEGRDYEGAIEAFSQAIKIDPNFWGAHMGRAEAYQQLGMEGRANADFEKAESLMADISKIEEEREPDIDAPMGGVKRTLLAAYVGFLGAFYGVIIGPIVGAIAGGLIGPIAGGIAGFILGVMHRHRWRNVVDLIARPVSAIIMGVIAVIIGAMLGATVGVIVGFTGVGVIVGGVAGGIIGVS